MDPGLGLMVLFPRGSALIKELPMSFASHPVLLSCLVLTGSASTAADEPSFPPEAAEPPARAPDSSPATDGIDSPSFGFRLAPPAMPVAAAGSPGDAPPPHGTVDANLPGKEAAVAAPRFGFTVLPREARERSLSSPALAAAPAPGVVDAISPGGESGFRGWSFGFPFAAPAILGADAAPPPPGAVGSGSRLGRFSARPGLGFTASPTTFLFALGLEYFVTENLSAGLQGQIGVSDDHFLAAPTLGVQWTFDLPYPGLERLKPLAQGGLGFAYLERDRPGSNPDEVGFLMNFGGGVDYYLTDSIAIGSTMLFNFLPDETLGDHFFFSWQVVAARFLF
jgi:hypothetical protein